METPMIISLVSLTASLVAIAVVLMQRGTLKRLEQLLPKPVQRPVQQQRTQQRPAQQQQPQRQQAQSQQRRQQERPAEREQQRADNQPDEAVKAKLEEMADSVKKYFASWKLDRTGVHRHGDLSSIRLFQPDWPHTRRNIHLMWFEIRRRPQGNYEILVLLTANIEGFHYGEARLSGADSRAMLNRLREHYKAHPELWGTGVRERRAAGGTVQLDPQRVPEEKAAEYCIEYVKNRYASMKYAIEGGNNPQE